MTTTETPNIQWRDHAVSIITRIAHERDAFTSDDIMESLKELPHDPRAVGPAIKTAAKLGIIHFTGRYQPSRRRHCSALRVWSRTAAAPAPEPKSATLASLRWLMISRGVSECEALAYLKESGRAADWVTRLADVPEPILADLLNTWEAMHQELRDDL